MIPVTAATTEAVALYSPRMKGEHEYMLRKFIGVLMLALLYGSLFAITVYCYSVREALIMFGIILAILIFCAIAVYLVFG